MPQKTKKLLTLNHLPSTPSSINLHQRKMVNQRSLNSKEGHGNGVISALVDAGTAPTSPKSINQVKVETKTPILLLLLTQIQVILQQLLKPILPLLPFPMMPMWLYLI